MGDQISEQSESKMTQTRGKKSQIELCRWIAGVFGATIVALLILTLIVMFKNLEESRTVSEELLSRLRNGEKERNDLRRDLNRMRAKLQDSSSSQGLFSTLRKDSRVIRNSRLSHRRCPKTKNCNHDHEKENYTHHFCGRVKTCSLKQHTGSPIYVELKEPEIDPTRKNLEYNNWDLRWRSYISKGGGGKFIIRDSGQVKVKQGGDYFVYCRVYLKNIDNPNPPILELMKNNIAVFSALPVSGRDAINKTVLQLQLFGLTEIQANTTLYVRLRFTSLISGSSIIFYYSRSPINNFGMLLVGGR